MTTASPIARRAYPVLFMLGITLVFISTLSALHLGTRDRVRQNERLFEQRAVREAAGLPSLADPAALRAWFDPHVTVLSVSNTSAAQPVTFYRVNGETDAAPIAYVFFVTGAGLWGDIVGAIGLDSSLQQLTGITFVSQNETPGLGARITEDVFRLQFRGKRGPFRLMPEGTRSAALDEVDGLTGATITSSAVRDMINNLLETAAATVKAGESSTTPPDTGEAH